MWRAFGGKGPSVKSVKGRLLLAHVMIRCIKKGQIVWQMLATCPNSICPDIAVTSYIPTHPVRSIVFRHSGSIPTSIESKKILVSSHWLLYQMDWGKGISHHCNKKARSNNMERHRLLVWSPKGYCYRPQKAIWLWLLQNILRQFGDSITFHISGISIG